LPSLFSRASRRATCSACVTVTEGSDGGGTGIAHQAGALGGRRPPAQIGQAVPDVSTVSTVEYGPRLLILTRRRRGGEPKKTTWPGEEETKNEEVLPPHDHLGVYMGASGAVVAEQFRERVDGEFPTREHDRRLSQLRHEVDVEMT
jgi:hypothetical protein